MSHVYESCFCPHCNRQVLAITRSPNHVLHFLISSCTLGLWVIVWLVVSLVREPAQCSVCGARTVRKRSLVGPILGGLGVLLITAWFLSLLRSPADEPQRTPARTAAPPEYDNVVRKPRPRPQFLTMQKYDRIVDGMTEEDVASILGGNGTELSSTSLGGDTFRMVSWSGPGIANMNVTFHNGRVTGKAQFGLEYHPDDYADADIDAVEAPTVRENASAKFVGDIVDTVPEPAIPTSTVIDGKKYVWATGGLGGWVEDDALSEDEQAAIRREMDERERQKGSNKAESGPPELPHKPAAVRALGTGKPLHALRTWTFADGRTIDAQLVSWSLSKVVLRGRDGVEIKTSPDGLSAADVAWVRSQIK